MFKRVEILSIFHLRTYPSRVRWGLELILGDICLPVHNAQRQTKIQAHIRNLDSKRSTNYPLDWGRKPENLEETHAHNERTCSVLNGSLDVQLGRNMSAHWTEKCCLHVCNLCPCPYSSSYEWNNQWELMFLPFFYYGNQVWSGLIWHGTSRKLCYK